MLYVNIINAYRRNIFMHQLDVERYKDKIYFAENSHEDVIWDYVVVFQNLNHEFDGIKYKKGGLIFIAGEPECMEPYCNKFLDQFDYVIMPHPHRHRKNIYHTNPALNWHFGRSFSKGTFLYNFDSLLSINPEKSKSISMMCSNKTMMPGHVLRYKFYQFLQKEFEGKIDFYGAGINPVDDKADIILPYCFHICVENSTDEHYWTEKIADAILGYSVPIYCGAPNILEYFPKEAIIIIDINKPVEASAILNEILENPEKEYQKHFDALVKSRSLLMNNFNIFPMLENFISEHHDSLGEISFFKVTSYMNMNSWKFRMAYARIKRFAFKLMH